MSCNIFSYKRLALLPLAFLLLLASCEKKVDKQEGANDVVTPPIGGCDSPRILSYWITEYVETNAIVLNTYEGRGNHSIALNLLNGQRHLSRDASEEYKKIARAHGEDGTAKFRTTCNPPHFAFCTVGVTGIRVEQLDGVGNAIRDVSELYQVYTWGFRANREVIANKIDGIEYLNQDRWHEKVALSTLTAQDFFWCDGDVYLYLEEKVRKAKGIARVQVVVEREGKPALTREVCYE